MPSALLGLLSSLPWAKHQHVHHHGRNSAITRVDSQLPEVKPYPLSTLLLVPIQTEIQDRRSISTSLSLSTSPSADTRGEGGVLVKLSSGRRS